MVWVCTTKLYQKDAGMNAKAPLVFYLFAVRRRRPVAHHLARWGDANELTAKM